ncbi:MAG: FAD-binding domain-containing protein [Puia sp.]
MKWRNDEKEFSCWCDGRTGYPLVDAGMRQLNQTGFMHNRVRMVTASFLCKHLLIDWRWGRSLLR